MFLCRLQSTQHHHYQELLPPATDPGDVGPALQSCVVVKAQAGTAEPTEASVQRYTEQCSPDPVDKVDDV